MSDHVRSRYEFQPAVGPGPGDHQRDGRTRDECAASHDGQVPSNGWGDLARQIGIELRRDGGAPGVQQPLLKNALVVHARIGTAADPAAINNPTFAGAVTGHDPGITGASPRGTDGDTGDGGGGE